MTIDKGLLLILKSSGLGDGEPDLGEKLLKGFLSTLYDSGTIPARIICLNSGVFLTTEGSPVGDVLAGFAERGAEILSCSTCLDYYGRADKLIIGQPTNMKETVAAILKSSRILTP